LPAMQNRLGSAKDWEEKTCATLFLPPRSLRWPLALRR
jgi:hypothetical protein